MKKVALLIDDHDNVATVFTDDVISESQIVIRDKRGKEKVLRAIGTIPYGHKIATQAITAGENIVKYGEVIGVASKNIMEGEYVHIHNIDALRGRGDL